MKIPEITQGEWQVNDEHKHIVHCRGQRVANTLSCDLPVDHPFNRDAVANAKAIKEVPRMIDVLCAFVWQYEHSNGDVHELDRELDKICLDAREVIQGAGVDLNQIKNPDRATAGASNQLAG